MPSGCGETQMYVRETMHKPVIINPTESLIATNDNLILFTLSRVNRPGTDLMSKHILLNSDVMNFIVKEIIGPNAVDEYFPQPTEWANATKLNVLYASNNTNSFPSILIDL